MANYQPSSSSPSPSQRSYAYFAPNGNIYNLPPFFASSDLEEAKELNINEIRSAMVQKISRYSPEERKERIERYRSKRNQRNFQKKITYECRKTLADSRPRVRGRFARNEEAESEMDNSESSYGTQDCNGTNGTENANWQMEGDEDVEMYYDEELWAHFVDEFALNI